MKFHPGMHHFLAPLSTKSTQRSCSYYWLSIVVVVNFLHFKLLLQNHKSECFQIWYTSTLGGSLSDLFISCRYLEFLYFWWIFWVIFDKNWYFCFFLQNRLSELFQIWYASFLFGFISDLSIMIKMTNLIFVFFHWQWDSGALSTIRSLVIEAIIHVILLWQIQ